MIIALDIELGTSSAIMCMMGTGPCLPIPLVADLLDPDLLAAHCTAQVCCGQRMTQRGRPDAKLKWSHKKWGMGPHLSVMLRAAFPKPSVEVDLVFLPLHADAVAAAGNSLTLYKVFVLQPAPLGPCCFPPPTACPYKQENFNADVDG